MPQQLSEKSQAILQAIARGHTYEQIWVQELAWTYHDIFQAAAEALGSASERTGNTGYEERMTEIRSAHPKAYQPWTNEDDSRLKTAHQAGASIDTLAQQFQRQPNAIRSRLAKLNIVA